MRTVERADLDWLRAMHNDPDTLRFLTDPTPVSETMQERWFAGLSDGPSRRYVVEDDQGRPIGMVRIDHLDFPNRCACVGLDVVPAMRGCGYGLKSYELLLKCCFHQWNLNMVWMLVADFNARAIGLYDILGFKHTGRLPQGLWRDGAYHDLLVLSLTRPEWEKTHAAHP